MRVVRSPELRQDRAWEPCGGILCLATAQNALCLYLPESTLNFMWLKVISKDVHLLLLHVHSKL